MNLETIGHVVSPYHEKFGVPRQPGLVAEARGYIQMCQAYAHPGAFEGLDGFSHIWVIFGFHACQGAARLRVRPPRLGGNRELGVFATRSPYRPNHLGLSVLTFAGLEDGSEGLRVRVSGLDLIDGTPIFDIKPYVPYTDSISSARGGFAASPPTPVLDVTFSEAARRYLAGQGEEGDALRSLIVQTLALDPRPAYRRGEVGERVYGVMLAGHDVHWKVLREHVIVDKIKPLQPAN